MPESGVPLVLLVMWIFTALSILCGGSKQKKERFQ